MVVELVGTAVVVVILVLAVVALWHIFTDGK